MPTAAHGLGETNSSDGALLSPQPTQMETFTGQYVDLLDPQSETIKLQDVAIGMARQRRYAGHTLGPISISRHVLHVAQLVEYEGGTRAEQLGALFHDAPEAYLTDLPAPLKYALRQLSTGKQVSVYDMLNARMEDEIFGTFKLPVEVVSAMDSEIVRHADLWALRIEADHLVRSSGENWRWEGLPPIPNGAPKGTYREDLSDERMYVDDRSSAATWIDAVRAFLPGKARGSDGKQLLRAPDSWQSEMPDFAAGWVV